MSLTGISNLLMLPQNVLRWIGSEQKTPADKPIVLDEDDIVLIRKELEEPAKKWESVKDEKKLEAGKCSLDHIYIKSDATRAEDSAVRAAVARRLLNKYIAGFAQIPDNIQDITCSPRDPQYAAAAKMIENKQKAINTLAEAIKTAFSSTKEINLQNLLGTGQYMSYKSYCTTYDSWWTPTIGKLPLAISLQNINYGAIKAAYDQAFGPAPATPTSIPVRPPVAPVTPPAAPAVATLGDVRVLRNGKPVSTVNPGSKIEIEITGSNLPTGTTISSDGDWMGTPRLKRGGTSKDKIVFETNVGEKDEGAKRTITVKFPDGKTENRVITLKIVKRQPPPPPPEEGGFGAP